MPLTDDTRRPRRFATIMALVVVAIVAIFQTSIIVASVGAQRDAAHIIDISGAQRMRSQALAYFALSLETGHPERDARQKIAAIVRAMAATRAEILTEPRYITGRRQRDGSTVLSRTVDEYLATIATIVRDPSNAVAFGKLRRERPLVLAALDGAVEKRVAIASAHNEHLLAALFAGLALQLGSIVGVWFAFVAPAERRGRALLADIRQAREESESTFAGNPDGIAVYDRTGHIVRVNAARARFVGRPPEELIGMHYSQAIDETDLPQTQRAFERAMAGETVHFEARLVAADGSPVHIAVTIFPRSINNAIVGASIVSKDMRQLRAAEAANAEQARRLTDLYEIASAHGRTTEELLNSAIGLVTVRLGYDWGVVSEICDELVTVVATYGEPEGVAVGEERPYKQSLVRLSVDAADAYEARDFRATPYAQPLGADNPWASVVGMKISVAGVLYGSVGFASKEKRDADLSAADMGFLRLSCALLATIIERGRQIRRLDTLAFSDPLTALPNRAQFAKNLAKEIASGETFAVHYIDLDRFKGINDRFGHSTGDTVLRITAQRLLRCTRSNDTVARLGGDEFAIIQGGPADHERATIVAERVVELLGAPIDIDGHEHILGASVGVAIYPAHGDQARELVEAADAALYRAKASGRGRFTFAEDRLVETALAAAAGCDSDASRTAHR